MTEYWKNLVTLALTQNVNKANFNDAMSDIAFTGVGLATGVIGAEANLARGLSVDVTQVIHNAFRDTAFGLAPAMTEFNNW